MRISPHTGKEYGIILDQAGNLRRLGFPEDIEVQSLPTQAECIKGSSVPPMKDCPSCGRLVLSFIVECPDCHHQWVTARRVSTEDMTEIYSATQARQIRDEDILKRLYHGHRRAAFRKKKPPTWADREFFDQCSKLPKPEWALGSLFGKNPDRDKMYTLAEYLRKSAKRIGETSEWDVNEFEKEVGAGSWIKLL
jgi:hypothetical protein